VKVKQKDLTGMLGEQNAQSVFDLNLKDFGPYKSIDFTSNGKHVLMGSKKGHVAMLNWKNKELICEF
jgi:U3 small nucleolar RNA-associated protein 7